MVEEISAFIQLRQNGGEKQQKKTKTHHSFSIRRHFACSDHHSYSIANNCNRIKLPLMLLKFRRKRSSKTNKLEEDDFVPMLSPVPKGGAFDSNDTEEMEHGQRRNDKGRRGSMGKLTQVFRRKSSATLNVEDDVTVLKPPSCSSTTYVKTTVPSKDSTLQRIGVSSSEESASKGSEESDVEGTGGSEQVLRPQGTRSLKAPSISSLDHILGDSDSDSFEIDSDGEQSSSTRRSTIRTAIAASLDESSHLLPFLAPPSASDVLSGSQSTMNDSANFEALESSMRKVRETINFFEASNSESVSYAQFSPSRPTKTITKESKVLDFSKTPSSSTEKDTSLSYIVEHLEDHQNYRSEEPEETTNTSRKSTIRSKIEATLDESTHPIPSMNPPSMKNVWDSQGNDAKNKQLDESTHPIPALEPPKMQELGRFNSKVDEPQTVPSPPKTKTPKSQLLDSAKSKKGRKSRSPVPDKKGKKVPSESDGKDLPARKKKASRSPNTTRTKQSKNSAREKTSKSPSVVSRKRRDTTPASPKSDQQKSMTRGKSTPIRSPTRRDRPSEIQRSLSSPCTRASASSRAESPNVRRLNSRRLSYQLGADLPLNDSQNSPRGGLERRRSTGTFEKIASEKGLRADRGQRTYRNVSKSPSERSRKALQRHAASSERSSSPLDAPPPPESSRRNRTSSGTPPSATIGNARKRSPKRGIARRRSTGTFEKSVSENRGRSERGQRSFRNPSKSPSERTRKAVLRRAEALDRSQSPMDASPPPDSFRRTRAVVGTPPSVHSRKGRTGLSTPSSVSSRKSTKRLSKSPGRTHSKSPGKNADDRNRRVSRTMLDSSVRKPTGPPMVSPVFSVKSGDGTRSSSPSNMLGKKGALRSSPELSPKGKGRTTSHPRQTEEPVEVSKQTHATSPRTNRINRHASSPAFLAHRKAPLVVD
eukprot:scaffold5850_cov110-Cylindrotheca_fusiformis.AAC.4